MDRFDGARIYFSPCGHGLGHVGRTHTVAEELRRRGAEILFSTYLDGVDFVRKQGFPVVRSPHLSMSTIGGRIDLKVTSVRQGLPAMPRFLRQMNAEIGFMKGYRPDLVVSDARLSSVFAANLLGVPNAVILNQYQPIVPRRVRNFKLSKIADGVLLTLIGRGWAASDLLLIPDFPEPHTISLESLRIPEPYRHLVRYVGPILSKKPEDVEDSGYIQKVVGPIEGRRLIFAPISGPQPERIPFLSILEPVFMEFPDRYRVIMSLGQADGGSEPRSKGSLTVVPWIPDRFEVLKACDLVISRAGHETIMQGICYGKPLILVPTPGHTEQYANARRVKELGVGTAIHQRDLTRDNLLRTIERVLGDDDKRNRLRGLCGEGGFGDGVSNTIKALEELLGR